MFAQSLFLNFVLRSLVLTPCEHNALGSRHSVTFTGAQLGIFEGRASIHEKDILKLHERRYRL